VVTSHLYDGTKSLPLDIELYQHATSLPEGKKDPEFLKKPEIAVNLIDKTLQRKYRPGIVIIDSGYGNNTSFLKKLENRKLKYLGGIAKNRKVPLKKEGIITSMRMDELAESLAKEEFTEVDLNLDKQKKVWVKTLEVEISQLKGKRSVAIVMNADTFEEATDIDYFITNVDSTKVTPQWVVETYSQRNDLRSFLQRSQGMVRT
jgi:SRSO17 transposase